MTLDRRSLLAASGLVAIGSLAGCLGRVASSATNTGASPAAVFAGVDWNDDDTEISFTFEGGLSGEPHVARLTPTLAGRVELEGWVTSTALAAEDYNSPRSNWSTFRGPDGDEDEDAVDDDAVRGEDYNTPRSNRSIAGPSDIVDDDIDDDDETFQRISRLDAQLEEATTAAATAISKRSARTGRNPETEREITDALGDMDAVLAEMRAVLERCSDESCVAALANVADREADVVRAREYARDGEWAAFGGDGDDILVGDYLLPPVGFDPSGSFGPGEQAGIFRYLEQRPVVAERFSVCLPDAEVPGGNGSIREAVTPERLFAYLTGRSDGEGRLYAWGKNQHGSSGPDERGDCDDDDSTVSPGAVCGETPHFVAEMTGPVATGGGLVAERTADGHVVVTVKNTPPSADGASVLVCPAEGEPFEPEGLDAWGERARDPPTTMDAQGRIFDLTVAQVMVQPPGCPEMVPALVYVGRGLSDGQLIYSGGWILDDAALYEDSATVLSMDGAAQVVPIGLDRLGDLDGDGFSDVVARAGLSERARRGARMDSGTVDELVNAGVFSADSFDPADPTVSDFLRFRSGGGGGGRVALTHVAVDAPVLHLMNASSASDGVKFKAGAELSKSVN